MSEFILSVDVMKPYLVLCSSTVVAGGPGVAGPSPAAQDEAQAATDLLEHVAR